MLLLLLAACSSSGESAATDPDAGVLIRKLTFVGITPSTGDFIYQGNKLDKAVFSDGSFTRYVYTGDFITKEEIFKDGSSQTPTYTIFYEYAGNQLLRKKMYEGDFLKSESEYTPNGTTVTIEHTNYTGSETSTSTVKKYFTDGEVTKREQLNPDGSVASTWYYYYDDRKSPSKNITGYNRAHEGGITGGYLHNLARVVYDAPSGSENSTEYFYEYNETGYPGKQTFPLRETMDESATGTMEILY